MAFLAKIINRARTTHLTYAQVFLVFLAFGIIVFFSYAYISGIERKHLRDDAYNALAIAQKSIESDLKEQEMTMNSLVRTVLRVIRSGGGAAGVTEYMKEVTEYLFGESEHISGFSGVYGYFDIFGGVHIHGGGKSVPEGFAARQPGFGFAEAVEAGGKTVMTAPYISAGSGEYVITYSCQLLNDKREQIGVIAFNVPLGRIKEIVAGTRLTESGYGVLMSGRIMIVHPTRSGSHLKDMHRGAEITREVERENGFFEQRINAMGYGGQPSVLFFKRLANGWYLGIVTPSAQYYASMWNIMRILVFLGATMAVLLSAVLINVTREKKKLAAEKLHSDEYAWLFFDATPVSCTLWDSSLKVINCNRATLKLLGVRNKEEYNQRFLELAPEFQPNGEKSAEMMAASVKKAFEDGFLRVEWTHKLFNGELLPCEVTLVRVKQGDGYLLAAYTRDMRVYKAHIAEMNAAAERLRETMEKLEAAAAEAQNANAAKSVFLANMSHEIRTPMNSIIGFSELALDDDIPEKTRGFLSNISESAGGLLAIINDILDISKIEAGKMELEHIPFDLRDIFAHCQSVIMPKAAEKGVALYCYAEPSVGKKLVGDPVRLRQALLNILSNAVKFTNIGTVKLLASINGSTQNSVTVHFEVKDSGIGMDRVQIDKIFNPFTQADNSITRKYGGTGLGLAITKNIIEMMGGRLQVESTVGVGSKFGFEIIFDAVDDVADIPSEKIVLGSVEKPNFEGEILVCEDNAMNQKVICEHLGKVGLKAVVAGNGRDGVAIVESRALNGEKPFDLILMDIHMPVMDGLEAASRIAGLGVKTPMVAVTANIMANEMELYKKHGIYDSLGKPFTSHELWNCLIKYLPVLNYTTIDRRVEDAENEKMLRQLKINFARNNQNVYDEIKRAVDAGDVKTAHRLAHSLKGNAGQILEKRLQEAAAALEFMLSEGESRLTAKQLAILKTELKASLERLAPLLKETDALKKAGPPSEKEIRELFDTLEPMLENRNPECMNLFEDIRAITGAEELARYVEKFKFKQALAVLSELKIKMGIV